MSDCPAALPAVVIMKAMRFDDAAIESKQRIVFAVFLCMDLRLILA
jgi:hypothetical protein